MTPNSWLDRLNQSRERIEALQTEFLAEVKREVAAVFAEFFIQNPDVIQVFWTQYDDYIGPVFGCGCGSGERLGDLLWDNEKLFYTLFGKAVTVSATRNGFEVKDV